MLMSAAIAMPATAAENAEEPVAVKTETGLPVTAEETAADTENSTDVFADGRADLKEIAAVAQAAEAAAPVAAEESVEPTQEEATDAPSVQPDLNGKLNPFRKGFYTNRITLKWSAVKGVAGYRIYWCNLNVTNAPTKLLATIADHSVTVSNLKPGSKFRFIIRPYINNGNKIVEGRASSLTAATIPDPVKSFKLKSGAQAGTVIQWSKVANIDGYLLLRQYNSVWSVYKYLAPTTTSFKDTNVIPGRAYYYKILTYRNDTRGYLNSDPVLLRTVCGLCAPIDTGTTSRLNKVYLSWRKIQFATGYEIFYSTDNKTFKGLAVTTSNTYTTKKFKEGQKVYFRIRPYRLVGASKTKVYGTVSLISAKVLANSLGVDVGNTYIEIDISDQHMWYIVKGDVYVSTDVVTGNYNSSDTPTGVYSINNMARNVSLVGADYVSFVEYWMAFIGSSYGIHDASWRSSFGGNIFRGNGSHGCVNTPYDAVKKIYNHASVGTPVVIHW